MYTVLNHGHKTFGLAYAVSAKQRLTLENLVSIWIEDYELILERPSIQRSFEENESLVRILKLILAQEDKLTASTTCYLQCRVSCLQLLMRLQGYNDDKSMGDEVFSFMKDDTFAILMAHQFILSTYSVNPIFQSVVEEFIHLAVMVS
jgi:hypothetical protein